VNILITAWRLIDYTGADLFTRDLAASLHGRGHEVVVYTPFPGRIAAALRQSGVPVINDLSRLTFAPQIIHGQHRPAMLNALKRFPAVPAICVMHGATAAIDAPFVFPPIRRYVAVDDFCLARLLREPGIWPDRARVMLNFVDLTRFSARCPLPPTPARALVFSNYADRRTHLPAVTEACRRVGLPLHAVGDGVGQVVPEPGDMLAHYDLVFAKARCAIEAMAVGAAVVLCDVQGLGPMVTAANFSRLRRMNFGAGVLTGPLAPDAIVEAMRDYDAADAAAVSARMRQEADMEQAIDGWLELYREVLDEAARQPVRETAADTARLDTAIRQGRSFFRRETVTRRLRQVRRIPLIGDRLYTGLHRLRRTMTQPVP
jgi:glycosyltransferase involved in cell wall biosynthesis